MQGVLDRAMRERIDEAVSVGLLPDSAGGALLAGSLGSLYAHAYERADEGEGGLRRWLLARLRTTADPHVERYWRLLGAVKGWPAAPALAPRALLVHHRPRPRRRRRPRRSRRCNAW
ncbi:hypothetical protein ACFV0H_38450 [Streptomyces erythrochromogenes]|uniref:hypothetical protein n=1 Tax=Streptomyces erythrochromogenes TaxID=285574 RepID=UPI00368D6123